MRRWRGNLPAPCMRSRSRRRRRAKAASRPGSDPDGNPTKLEVLRLRLTLRLTLGLRCTVSHRPTQPVGARQLLLGDPDALQARFAVPTDRPRVDAGDATFAGRESRARQG